MLPVESIEVTAPESDSLCKVHHWSNSDVRIHAAYESSSAPTNQRLFAG